MSNTRRIPAKICGTGEALPQRVVYSVANSFSSEHVSLMCLVAIVIGQFLLKKWAMDRDVLQSQK